MKLPQLSPNIVAAAACFVAVAIGFYDLEWGHQLQAGLANGLLVGGLSALGGGTFGLRAAQAVSLRSGSG